MTEETPLRFRGRCFYNGRKFVAQISDHGQYRTLKEEPHLAALLEEAFNFLLSADEERTIAGHLNKKGRTGTGLPYVFLQVAGARYGLVAAAKQPNAAQLWLSIPFYGNVVPDDLVADEISNSENYDMAQAGESA